MKGYLVILSCFLFLSGFQLPQGSGKGFTVKGTISGLKDSDLYLSYMIEGKRKTDTVRVKNNVFVFKGSITEPCVAMLNNSDNSVQRLFLLDNSSISLQGVYGPPTDVTVKGSQGQMEYESLQDAIQKNRNTIFAAQKIAEEASNRETEAHNENIIAQKQLNLKYDSLCRNEQAILKSFIKEHPDSYLSANQLFYNSNENNLKESRELYESFSPKVKQSYDGRQVAARLSTLEKVQIGRPVLDFTQKDTLGNPVKLSSFKGKYVLLEFWASWCGPCRAEGPNLLKAYEKYKDSGLVILAVSLDKDADQWKRAIRKDHLPWTHVSDLKYFNNEVAEQYGVHAVPANFLISPEGKILAKDLRGEALHKTLAGFINNAL